MGCTSSAPNMVNSSTAEKRQLEEEMREDQSKDSEEIIYRVGKDTNEMNVLPSCDTLAEPIHVVRNKSTPSLNTEKGNQEDRHVNERINKTDSSGTLKEEEISPKLEEMVEKTVEVWRPDKGTEAQNVLQIAEETQNDDHKDNKEDGKNVEHNEECLGSENDNQKEDHLEEALSPSQSESSRATRWEALADIAAELPPSLTVDPITGQIYALTK